MLNHRNNDGGISCRSISAVHRPIQVGNCPGLGARLIQVPGDEMQMKVLGPFAKSNGIDALTASDLLHKKTGIAYGPPPVHGFGLREIHRT